MKTSLILALICCAIGLYCSLRIYLLHRRAGTPLSGHEIGAVAGTIGMPLLLTAVSMELDGTVAIVLVILALLLSFFSAVMTHRANRQMRSGGR